MLGGTHCRSLCREGEGGEEEEEKTKHPLRRSRLHDLLFYCVRLSGNPACLVIVFAFQDMVDGLFSSKWLTGCSQARWTISVLFSEKRKLPPLLHGLMNKWIVSSSRRFTPGGRLPRSEKRKPSSLREPS